MCVRPSAPPPLHRRMWLSPDPEVSLIVCPNTSAPQNSPVYTIELLHANIVCSCLYVRTTTVVPSRGLGTGGINRFSGANATDSYLKAVIGLPIEKEFSDSVKGTASRCYSKRLVNGSSIEKLFFSS